MEPAIEYSMHAIQRMFERDISEKQVEQTIRNPDYTKTMLDGRKASVKKFNGRTITILYVKKETNIRIITVY